MNGTDTHTIFLSADAADMLARLCAAHEEDGWEYYVDTDEQSGRALVRVYDEHGYHVGNL